MIFLYTGLPGAAKTLNVIKDIHEQDVFSGRNVYYYNLKDCTIDDWTELSRDEAINWFDLPEGSVVFFDEGQDLWRPRKTGQAVPESVEKMEKHRHLGMDLIITCQFPRQLDTGVRNLVGRHYHYERSFGFSSSRRFEYQEVQNDPKDHFARQDAIVSRVKLDSKYYGLYKSAEVHTHKSKVPKKLISILILFFALLYFSYSFYNGFLNTSKKPQSDSSEAIDPDTISSFTNGLDLNSARSRSPVIDSIESYMFYNTPLISGLPHTAPIYSELTAEPKSLPIVDGCLQLSFSDGRRICRCNTDQGTIIDMSDQLCSSIVKAGGLYNAYKDPEPYDPNYSYNIGLTASVTAEKPSQSKTSPSRSR